MTPLSQHRLSYQTLSAIPRQSRPAIDPRDRSVKMVHLGVGAFHRAHQAAYTEQCGDWGIYGVTQRTPKVVEQLAPQDCLYTLVERNGDQPRLRVIGAIRDILFAGDDPARVVRQMADPDVSVITTTVTEKGYRHDPATRELKLADPTVAADLSGRPPQTVIGQIAAACAARAEQGAPALAIVCCDNIPENGATLATLVRTFLERSAYPPSALEWLMNCASFPATMVDRIVPATTPADHDLVTSELGVEDEGVVASELFTQWVIEDRFLGPRPRWETAGALLVDDVRPYEQLKLRLLNGGHSALAYLGGLAGYATIADAAADPTLSAYVAALMRNDVAPTLTVPRGVDVEKYEEVILRRFSNTALNHQTRQVAMDGSYKLPQRLLATIRDGRARGREPAFATLAVAAWMRHILDATDDDGRPFEPDDPLLDTLRSRAVGSNDAEGLLNVEAVFGDLAGDTWFRHAATRMLGSLRQHRVVDVVRQLTRAGEDLV